MLKHIRVLTPDLMKHAIEKAAEVRKMADEVKASMEEAKGVAKKVSFAEERVNEAAEKMETRIHENPGSVMRRKKSRGE